MENICSERRSSKSRVRGLHRQCDNGEASLNLSCIRRFPRLKGLGEAYLGGVCIEAQGGIEGERGREINAQNRELPRLQKKIQEKSVEK